MATDSSSAEKPKKVRWTVFFFAGFALFVVGYIVYVVSIGIPGDLSTPLNPNASNPYIGVVYAFEAVGGALIVWGFYLLSREQRPPQQASGAQT